jgi:hypothetical protein
MTAQIQNNGLARITATLAALSFWLGWGVGSAAAKSATNLQSPAPEARAVATAAQGTVTISNDALILTAVITATAPHAITEFGAFDAASGGNLDFYSDFVVMNVNAGDSINYTLNLRFS